MSNLPQGLHERDIPGCSTRDEFLQRKQEQIDEQLAVLPEWLRDAIMLRADFATIAERCNWLYENEADGYAASLEEARNLAQQADDGHEPEPEYEKEDELP